MKLKKLIVSGFKSFADRTEFEFHEGVSCIVGPNGCGKSNVVDAVKWVLGEQSAKSLRGSEMADVIFNGSSARRPAGMAEVSLIFDNGSGTLKPNVAGGADGDGLVSIGRRLYRSGHSEYLINKIPCRLKDIREMFMDTGIGRDAYSLVEQGRVEMFLQASHDERRAIFDEAAGISKYKARRTEALRKLERVEQNLLRLNDILAEVEKRLRSIKYQAGKARSYQVHSQRLKELRSLHFLARYHTLRRQRGELQGRLDSAGDQLAAITTRIGQLEAAGSATELEAVDLERAARDLQGLLAGVGGQILTGQQRADMLAARVSELGEQIAAGAGRCEHLEAKIEQLDADRAGRAAELSRIEAEAAELSRKYDGVCQEHSAGELALTELAGRLEDEKAGTIDLLRRTAELHNEIHGLGIRREGLHGQRARLADRADQVAEALRGALADRAKVAARLQDVREVLSDAEGRLERNKQDERSLLDEQQKLDATLLDARERRSAVCSRIGALEEMQQRLEGVAAGVRRVLQARQDGRLQFIRGMLGRFLETDLEHALLVEAALAGADQQLLAARFDQVVGAAGELADVLGEGGSVQVLALDRLEPFGDDFDVSACPQAIGRVIDYVRCEPWLAPAIWRLIGRTLVVASLTDAAEAAQAAPRGYRFVTRAGEVLEADGSVRLGSANRAAGVIARRSELSRLGATTADLDEQIDRLQRRFQELRDRQRHLDEVQQRLRTVIYEANTERVEAQTRLAQIDEQIARLQREEPLIAQDLKAVGADIEASVRAEHEAKEKAAELERLNRQRQQEIDRLTERIAAARQRQEQLSSLKTEMKVALVQADEKRQSISRALADLTRQHEQMREDLEKGRGEIEVNRQRRAEAEDGIVQARSEVDRLYAQQKQLDRQAEETEQTRCGLQEKLQEIREKLAEQRRAHEQATDQLNALRVEQGEIDVRVEDLIARASEEMSMDLLELYASYEHDEGRDWDAVEAEIQDLREKIERLGNVNLDAIAEQEQLQQRREFLAGQLADVQASRQQLTELIRRINRQSRQMFLETFDAIRDNFRDLFRKLFGGGRADVFLVDTEDVLTSAIEIVAQPPGKDLRSLMLLSGGEKTMTAIALIFSIFKSRPSPFCLLDEVDAALDEMNNERFNHLVREFVSTSQIVIISHAKRTMGMANILYGVTMQEPGVSKRISVRFEDAGSKLDEQLAPVGA